MYALNKIKGSRKYAAQLLMGEDWYQDPGEYDED